ncbi:uncharacterized protein K460DRAFT_412073 [Cucurbitaria berberidis CBS 394.84]|uniref:Uncharacterized protein n=1 Tax=Cucurbitaria berberidis CBS 394.84 TaxID=1168544 RepID=A0A9P4LD34_9PLEO|nr:uncharacterized protein K460DRAFT_412073 [Cucurbitaria berberidis CBS 394.84]KAF1850358.1 hypothetical protein K460DRAFT_412073 [Cucurbitaria berberidis CBS 394.84]
MPTRELYRTPAFDRRKLKQSYIIDYTYKCPTSEEIESARQDVLHSLEKRKDIAGWVRANRSAIRRVPSDQDRRKPSRQNLIYSQVYDLAYKHVITPSFVQHAEVKEAIKSYAQCCCRELIANVARFLPIELRMMIFDLLTFQPNMVIPGEHRAHYQGYIEFEPYQGAMEVTNLINSKYFLTSSFMGPLAKEVIEAFFRVNRFHIYDSYNLGAYTGPVSIHCSTNEAIVPTHSIRHMVVVLRGDMRDTCIEAKTRKMRYGQTSRRFGLRPTKELCESLELLLTSKRPRGLHLEIPILANDGERLDDILDTLKGTRHRLIAAGVHVRVTSQNYEQLWYPQCLDAYYGCAKEDWYAILAAHRRVTPVRRGESEGESPSPIPQTGDGRRGYSWARGIV